jgi:uncharacterized membrane protein YeiB
VVAVEEPTGSGSARVALAARVEGIDVARAVAFGGMLLAHFASSGRRSNPPALTWLDNAANSWSGPLFCLVLGAGAGLLAARGAPDRLFVRRGIALFILGLALWPHVHSVLFILPHLGLLLALVPLLRRIPDRWLLPMALVAFVVPSLVAAAVDDHGLRRATQPATYGDLLEIREVAGNLLWDGGYPLAGWVGFVLVGLWLARRPLDDARTLRRLLVGGFLVSISQPLVDVGFKALDGRPHDPSAGDLAAFLDTSAHSNRTAWYVLACATVLAVAAACLLTTRRRRRAVMPLVFLGQLALTAYLAHIALLQAVVRDWRIRSNPALLTQFVMVAIVFLAFAGAATAWRWRWRRGPVEAALRAVSG